MRPAARIRTAGDGGQLRQLRPERVLTRDLTGQERDTPVDHGVLTVLGASAEDHLARMLPISHRPSKTVSPDNFRELT